MRSMSAPHRLLSPSTVALAVALFLAGCASSYEPFDSVEHLRGQYATKTELEAPSDILVPFEIDDGSPPATRVSAG